MKGMEIELWVEYGIGVLVFFLRFFARYRVVGIKGVAWDDFFSFVAMILWTVDAATVQIITDYGSFVGLNEQTAAAVTDKEAARLAVGSKALFTAWVSYTTLIWCLKACLLCFYGRLTLGLWQQKLVVIMRYVLVVAYLAAVLTLFIHCVPIRRNWQIKPYVGDKCTITVANYIMVASMNVLTDLGLLAIPIPLIWAVKLPLGRKLLISLLLCSGIFVITAALLRCILSLSDVRKINNSTIWGIRETFVSVIAINAPIIKPLFNKKKKLPSANDDLDKRPRFLKFYDFSKSTAASPTLFESSGQHPSGPWLGASMNSEETELKLFKRTGSQNSIILHKGRPDEENQQAPSPINIADDHSTERKHEGPATDGVTVGTTASVSTRSAVPDPTREGRSESCTSTTPGNFIEISAAPQRADVDEDGKLNKVSRMLGVNVGSR